MVVVVMGHTPSDLHPWVHPTQVSRAPPARRTWTSAPAPRAATAPSALTAPTATSAAAPRVSHPPRDTRHPWVIMDPQH